MTMQNKIHNRTLFVAALSVYFGLLIVGAPSQTFAQTNKAISVKSDNAAVAHFSEIDLANHLIKISEATFGRIGFLKLTEDPSLITTDFYASEVRFAPYFNKFGKLIDSDWKSDLSDWASEAQAGEVSELDSSFAKHFGNCSNFKKSKREEICRSIQIQINNSELNCQIFVKQVSNRQSQNVSDNLNKFFFSETTRAKETLVKQIYENTSSFAQNNQVFIVTRLPRAALDKIEADAQPREK